MEGNSWKFPVFDFGLLAVSALPDGPCEIEGHECGWAVILRARTGVVLFGLPLVDIGFVTTSGEIVLCAQVVAPWQAYQTWTRGWTFHPDASRQLFRPLTNGVRP